MFYYYPLTKRQLWPVGLFCSPWPEQALRANIHCQISLALNRIYTEWYPSKGYSFNITNSTSYDQYYVHGRTVFDVMVRLTDDIFNTYIRKTGTVNPYYAEYCDGKIRHLPRPQAVGDGHAGQSGPQRTEHPQILLWQQHRDHPHQQHPVHPPELPRKPSAAGQHRSGGVHPAAAAQPHHQRLSLPRPWLTVDGIFGRKMTETVKKFQSSSTSPADRRGGPQHLV